MTGRRLTESRRVSDGASSAQPVTDHRSNCQNYRLCMTHGTNTIKYTSKPVTERDGQTTDR